MSAARPRGATVPRLQELAFLNVAAREIAAGSTYEQIRVALIVYMGQLRELEAPTGNHAAFRLAVHNPTRYLSNATEAIGELMRLGLVDKSPLPTTSSAAPSYAQRIFTLTEAGRSYVDLYRSKDPEQRRASSDELLVRLWRTHHQFSGYLRLLAHRPVLLPTAKWSDAHPQGLGALSRGEANARYVAFLAGRCANAAEAGMTGWSATRDEIESAIRGYLDDRYRAAEKRGVGTQYARNRDFVGACEEAVVSFAFRRLDMPLDYISLEILRRWTRALGVANFSYYVPGPPALRLWVAGEFDESADGQLRLPVRRRLGEAYWREVIDRLPQAYEQARRADPHSTWVPIYRVRAAVAFELNLVDSVVDAALTEFTAGRLCPDAPFRLNLDPAEFGTTPPTETPLRIAGRTHRVMALVPKTERNIA